MKNYLRETLTEGYKVYPDEKHYVVVEYKNEIIMKSKQSFNTKIELNKAILNTLEYVYLNKVK